MTHGERAVPRWDRWEWLWHGVFLVTLVMPTVITLTRAEPIWPERLLTVAVAVAVAFGVWYWLLPVRHPQWSERVRPNLLYLIGATIFTLVLIERDESYTFLIYGLYPQMFILLGRWGTAGAIGVTLLVLPRAGLFAEGLSPGAILSLVGSAGLAVVLGLFIRAIATQSEQRQQALEGLSAARSDLAEAARRAGVMEERQRMARDIHDTVAQGLSSIVMLLEAAEQDLAGTAGGAGGHIGQAKRTAREGLAGLRRSVLSLRPDELQQSSLPNALELVVARWSERTGVASSIRVLGEPYPLHPETEVALLRTTQEALANVAKHASAQRVTVTLAFEPAETSLDIRDDGRGFELSQSHISAGGFGLTGVRQRIASVGGRASVESTPDAGTMLVAAVPRTIGPAR